MNTKEYIKKRNHIFRRRRKALQKLKKLEKRELRIEQKWDVARLKFGKKYADKKWKSELIDIEEKHKKKTKEFIKYSGLLLLLEKDVLGEE